jgi:hypothetical protein
MYHRGGILRFRKLTMSDADLEILPIRSELHSTSAFRITIDSSLPGIRRIRSPMA